MKTFSLGQKWVSSVTKPDSPDISVMGAHLSPLPSVEQLSNFLDDLSRSNAAREMSRRKWFKPSAAPPSERVAERGNALLEFLGAKRTAMPAYAMFRGRASFKQNILGEVATRAWIAHVTDVAQESAARTTFEPSNISKEFIKSLAKLSTQERGPQMALDAVREIGICTVVVSGLPSMSVDGASFHTKNLGPVLAMTLRHNRLDNFWFTLFHEIGHIYLHLESPSDEIFVDSVEDNEGEDVEAEAEADAFAKDSLIPRDIWFRSDAYRFGTETAVQALAKQLEIHPAIVAGRIRYERKEFTILPKLIGYGEVKKAIVLAD